jgi:hypothetical protein
MAHVCGIFNSFSILILTNINIPKIQYAPSQKFKEAIFENFNISGLIIYLVSKLPRYLVVETVHNSVRVVLWGQRTLLHNGGGYKLSSQQ